MLKTEHLTNKYIVLEALFGASLAKQIFFVHLFFEDNCSRLSLITKFLRVCIALSLHDVQEKQIKKI